tara:strand:+ start:935 stop:3283 length:2349 start_codon:yes stop_codon:yes gene_type:complete
MATIDLGKIRLFWRGTYVASTQYEYNDAVFYNNSSYVYINTSPSAGNTPSSSSAYWQVLATGADLTTRGDILYYGASGNTRLPAGTSGQYLQTKGNTADPVWANGTQPTDYPHRGILPYTYSSSLVPQTRGTAKTCSYDGSNNTFTVSAHGMENGQRVRFVGSSNMVTSNTNFAVDYTYYVRDKTTDTFKLCKTYEFGTSQVAGAVVTGATSVSSVENLYEVRLISDNWGGWDHVNGVSEIEGGIPTRTKWGGAMQHTLSQTYESFNYINHNHDIVHFGRQSNEYAHNYNESDTTQSAGNFIPLCPTHGSLKEGEYPVQITYAGDAIMYVRTNMGNVWSAGENDYGQLGHGDTTTRYTFEKIEFFEDNNLFVLGIVGTMRYYYNSSQDSYPSVWFICADKNSGSTNGIPNHERRMLYSCGYNGDGQLGLGDTTNRSTPTRITFSDQIEQVVVGAGYQNKVMCVVNDTSRAQEDGNSALYYWGRNDHGDGLGTYTTNYTSPTEVTGFDEAKDVKFIWLYDGDYDDNNSDPGAVQFFLTSTGKCYASGRNNYGGLGVGTTSDVYTWTHSGGSLRFREVYCSEHQSVALEGIPGTGHHGQTYGAWGTDTKAYTTGRNYYYSVSWVSGTKSTWVDYAPTTVENAKTSTGGSVNFPQGRIVLAQPEFVGNLGVTWFLDCNSNVWVIGADDDYDWTIGDSGTEIQYPFAVCTSGSACFDYTANEHNLNKHGNYFIYHFPNDPAGSRTCIHFMDNQGRLLSMGENEYEVNMKGQQGDTRTLTYNTNDIF